MREFLFFIESLCIFTGKLSFAGGIVVGLIALAWVLAAATCSPGMCH